MGTVRRDPTVLAAIFFFIAAPVLLLGGPREERRAEAQRDYGLIDFFAAEVEDAPNRRVRFEWGLTPRPDAGDGDEDVEEITCTLDYDDDGILEESIENCDEETSVLVSYDEPGTYRAVLVARDRAGNADLAVTTVSVE